MPDFMAVKKTYFFSMLRRFSYGTNKREIFTETTLKSCEKQPNIYNASKKTVDDRIKILRSVAEECQTEEELSNLVMKKTDFTCYDGFEPSGRMHVAQGLFKAINVNKCVDAGGTFVFWIADWFALMNDKMGGELQRIRLVGKYFVEVWRASGMKMENVMFKWASEEISKRPREYWKCVLSIARRNTLARITKCCQIMGRKEGRLSAAQILYPLMQCSDIFFLKADICQLGLDQRKVNMLARDYCEQINRKVKPIILSHHMIRGLREIRDEDGSLKKMSKSDPDSAIFMEDGEAEIKRKILNAYCPRKNDIEANPCLDYIQNIIFARQGKFLQFESFEKVKEAFQDGALPEEELKNELASLLNSYIDPVRKHFAENADARNILSEVRSLTYNRNEKQVVKESKYSGLHKVAWIYPSVAYQALEIIALVNALNSSVHTHDKVSLIFADWSAESVNCEFTKKDKDIETIFTYMCSTLQSYGLHPSVQITRQSSIILADPDRYWLKVIEIGRKLSVSDIQEKWDGGMLLAGSLLAALMHISDICVSNASDIVSYTQPTHAACPCTRFTDLVVYYLRENHSLQIKQETLHQPMANFLCEDSPEAVRKKIKKLYAPIGVVQDNLLLSLVQWVMDTYMHTPFQILVDGVVQQVYDQPYTLIEDYQKEKIHPGDLKISIAHFLIEQTPLGYEKLSKLIDSDPKLRSSLKMLRKK